MLLLYDLILNFIFVIIVFPIDYYIRRLIILKNFMHVEKRLIIPKNFSSQSKRNHIRRALPKHPKRKNEKLIKC